LPNENTRPFLHVAAPVFAGHEKAYVNDCLETSWISSLGPYVDRFEKAFAAFCGRRHALSCSNGTTALHLAFVGLHLQPGDEVIVPTLTFVATANTVHYCGARPVFVDVDPVTWTIDPAAVEASITPHTRGIVAVHLFGHPADLDRLHDIAARHNLWVLEDCAQAHGAEHRGRRAGSLGDVAAFSFAGNKIVTAGEGGMVLTDDDEVAERLRMLKAHGMHPQRKYWFPEIGFNYRLTNIAAAIGLAQLEQVEWHLARRADVSRWYREMLRGVTGVSWQGEADWARHVWWMFTIVLDDLIPFGPEALAAQLLARGVETRPVVIPMHALPPYQHLQPGARFPVADRLAARGLSLPTSAALTRDDVAYVCEAVREILHEASSPMTSARSRA